MLHFPLLIDTSVATKALDAHEKQEGKGTMYIGGGLLVVILLIIILILIF